ncbi:MAG: DUF4405 domain-containing protein [Geminicoccaceae bacterium]|nr:DUF4405 domain-containing protein [Geminicoccaceae bacterium]
MMRSERAGAEHRPGFRLRAFVVFVVAATFLIMLVTGLVLFIAPHGRIARWNDWRLLGLGLDPWTRIHVLASFLFVLAIPVHLFFNWKPFTKYLADRWHEHLRPRLELLSGVAVALCLALLAGFGLPPAAQLFAWQDEIKASWQRAGAAEPPFGHAEELPLPELARRTGLDLEATLAHLAAKGFRVERMETSLLDAARALGVTPVALFAELPKRPVAPPSLAERYGPGSGVGRKTVAQVAGELGIPLEDALRRLADRGVPATADTALKSLAERTGGESTELVRIIAGER